MRLTLRGLTFTFILVLKPLATEEVVTYEETAEQESAPPPQFMMSDSEFEDIIIPSSTQNELQATPALKENSEDPERRR